MKKFLILISLITLSSSAFAAISIGNAPGLSDSDLKQFQCSINVQQIDPETGDRGEKGLVYSIVVAANLNNAKAAALNKLNFYGPVKGSLCYLNNDGRQFEIKSIACN